MRQIRPYLYVLPFLMIMVFIFFGGLAQAFLQSLGYLPVFGMNDFTLDYYRQVINDARFISSLRYTFYIALLSSLLSVILGVILAFIVRNLGLGGGFSFKLYRVPIIMPHIVVVILIFGIFFQTGIISRITFAIGLINNPHDFPLLVNDRGGIGIMLVYLYKQVPFVAYMIFTSLQSISPIYGSIAENLGASRLRVFYKIILPMIFPSILSAFLITFAFAFGAFEVPFLLGSPARQTLPVLAYIDYSSPVHGTRPPAMAMSIIISAISLCLIWAYAAVLKRFSKFGIEGGLL